MVNSPGSPSPPMAQLWAQLPLPLWIARPTRELVYANAAARELQAQGQVELAAGRLMRIGSLAALQLEPLLHWCEPDVPQRAALWLVPSQRTGWLQALPLKALLAHGAGWPLEGLLLTLHLDYPELAQRARVDSLCERVHLSPAERSVLLLLADGLVPEAVAGTLDIRLSTARAHVRHLLLKTHAPSLAQLLRWVGSAEARPG